MPSEDYPVEYVDNTKALDEGTKIRLRKRDSNPMLFTLSAWMALAHISADRGTAVENGYPDPWKFFPRRIMQQVDYGIAKAGIKVEVVGYANPDGVPLGVVMYLLGGVRGVQDLGCYAFRIEGAKSVTAGELARQNGQTMLLPASTEIH